MKNLTHHRGDILNTTLPVIAHGCNTQGVMGAGIARYLRKVFPSIFLPYKSACANGKFTAGSCLPILVNADLWVANLGTQDLPGKHARLEWVDESLEALTHFLRMESLRGVALPRIGAGIGGLDWEDVLEVMETHANKNPDLKFEIWTL